MSSTPLTPPPPQSMLCAWFVLRRKLDPKKADLALGLSNCVTCLAFHPTDPSLLAGGAFNGEVLLWNLGVPAEPLVGKSSLSAYSHHEPVPYLRWPRARARARSHGDRATGTTAGAQ